MPPSERPWLDLQRVAVEVQDTSLMRTAADGFLRDQLVLALDSAGARIRTQALVMQASGRWNEAIRLFDEGYRRGAVLPLPYLRYVGTAHDRAGRPDSAIAYFERFVSRRTGEMYLMTPYTPRVHRRLGELYENRNEDAKAVEHYNTFLEYWKDAEPVFQPDVQEVRRRVDRLRAKTG
jgi:tetratricopeptide (TPR) repeat protein